MMTQSMYSNAGGASERTSTQRRSSEREMNGSGGGAKRATSAHGLDQACQDGKLIKMIFGRGVPICAPALLYSCPNSLLLKLSSE